MLYKREILKDESNIDEFLACINRNRKKIEEIDNDAKEKGEILHRFLYFPFADGSAVYQIVKVQKKTVKVRVCEGVGDDWVLPLIGEEGTIPLNKAYEMLTYRDRLDELFKNKRED